MFRLLRPFNSFNCVEQAGLAWVIANLMPNILLRTKCHRTSSLARSPYIGNFPGYVTCVSLGSCVGEATRPKSVNIRRLPQTVQLQFALGDTAHAATPGESQPRALRPALLAISVSLPGCWAGYFV